MLIPVYKELFETSENVGASTPADQELLVALVCAFDKNAAKALNDEEGSLWQVFREVLRTCLIRGKNCAVLGSQSH